MDKSKTNGKENISKLSAFNLILKSSLGTGFISLPLAFKSSGWVLGTVLSIFLTFLFHYSLYLLLSAWITLSRGMKRNNLSFPDCISLTFKSYPCLAKCSAKLSLFAGILIVLCQFCVQWMYFLFVTNLVKELIDHLTKTSWSFNLVVIFTSPWFFFPMCIRKLRILGPLVFISNILAITCIGIIFYLLFEQQRRFPTSETYEFQPFKNRSLGFFGTYLMSFESFGVILAVAEEMRKPSHLIKPLGVLNSLLPIVIILNLSIGIVGYFTFGDYTKASLLDQFENKTSVIISMKYLFIIQLLTSFSLQGHSIITILWKHNLIKKVQVKNHFTYEMCIRSFLIICSMFLAFIFQGNKSIVLQIISIITGGILIPIVSMIIPSILHLMVRFLNLKDRSTFHIPIFLDVLIIMFSLCICIITIAFAVLSISRTNFEEISCDGHNKQVH